MTAPGGENNCVVTKRVCGQQTDVSFILERPRYHTCSVVAAHKCCGNADHRLGCIDDTGSLADACTHSRQVLNTSCGTDRWLVFVKYGRQFSAGAMMALLIIVTVSRPALGPTIPPMQWVPEVLTPGLKRPGRETDHSPPSSAEVNAWSYTSVPPIRLHGVVLN
jgi:hypothetical protein